MGNSISKIVFLSRKILKALTFTFEVSLLCKSSELAEMK